jgi:hypothetical protein
MVLRLDGKDAKKDAQEVDSIFSPKKRQKKPFLGCLKWP